MTRPSIDSERSHSSFHSERSNGIEGSFVGEDVQIEDISQGLLDKKAS